MDQIRGALSNWGLALQFCMAIQLQFYFHRAIYNLRTILYGLAEDKSRAGGHMNTNEVFPDELYSQSAIYIAAAHTLKPNYSVYTSALKLVRSMILLHDTGDVLKCQSLVIQNLPPHYSAYFPQPN